MDTIELFCGAGGGMQAHAFLLGHTPVAAAEWADYPQEVLRARMADGSLPKFKLWRDVREASGKGFRGVGCVSGGFPCQDVSAAAGNKSIGIDGERSKMIWEMLRVVKEAQPGYVFAENSPRLRAKGLNRIICALTMLGYHRIAWGVISAADVKAPHLRERMWLLAKRSPGRAVVELPVDMPRDGTLLARGVQSQPPWLRRQKGLGMPTLIAKDAAASGNRPDPTLWSLSDVLGITAKAKKMGIKTLPTLAATDWKSPYGLAGLKKQLAKRSKPLRDVLPFLEGGRKINPAWAEWYMGWVPGWTALPRIDREDRREWKGISLAGQWWTDRTEKAFLPRTLPSAEGVPHIGARIKALGNGQVPMCCAAAFTLLKQAVD
jgi:site-specific DNA-cytosine methylase